VFLRGPVQKRQADFIESLGYELNVGELRTASSVNLLVGAVKKMDELQKQQRALMASLQLFKAVLT